MAKLAHPPPAAVHGLLGVKIGAPFAKRLRRFAHLENAVLELRRAEGAPVELSLCLTDVDVSSDATSMCISLLSSSVRMRLYLSSHSKFCMWLKAVQRSVSWLVHHYYHMEAQPFARGHCAAVYRAHDRATRASVAVKHIDAEVARAATHVVSRELRVCKLVLHRNVVQVRDVFESRDGVYIVMEAVDHTLQQWMDKCSRLSESEAAHVTRQLLCALVFLHGLNIVHRDIKPDNVLLTELSLKGTVKVCDFGLANFTGKRVRRRRAGGGALTTLAADGAKAGTGQALSTPMAVGRALGVTDAAGGGGGGEAEAQGGAIDGQTLTTAVGAPAFVAPELLQRRPYGAPVDVWAAGVTLFYMLSGRLPFGGACVSDVLRAVRDGGAPPPPPPGVSPSAADLLQRMLRRDPRHRITAESALRHSWLL